MTSRTTIVTALAAVLLPFAASAATTPAPAMPAAHPHAVHATAHAHVAPRAAGSAAVDALNDQSLARARGTAPAQ